MKEKTCCFTGRRDIANTERAGIKANTQKAIVALIENGVTYFGAGGARGFDTLAAETVLELKAQYPHIKLILILPCTDQTKGWSEEEKAHYEDIRCRADKVKILSKMYYRGCMHARNRHMVDHAIYCICYCRRASGGTAYTVDYAIKNGLHVIRV